MASLSEILGGDLTAFYLLRDQIMASLRVSMPGVIDSFDPATQSASVKPSINDAIIDREGKRQWVSLPLITDVPVQVVNCKDYAITLPIQSGDPCVLLFADSCMDAFFQSGSESTQPEIRHHDLSDAVAIIGYTTGNAPIENYSPDKLEVRHKTKEIKISLSDSSLNLKMEDSTIDMDNEQIKLTSSIVDINGTLF